MFNKLIAIVMLLMLSVVVQPATAEEKKDTKSKKDGFNNC